MRMKSELIFIIVFVGVNNIILEDDDDDQNYHNK